MPKNEWLAIDAATTPSELARQIRTAWEQFIADPGVATSRPPIAASWERSYAAGVDPRRPRIAPTLADRLDVAAEWRGHALAAAAPLIHECLGTIADQSEHLVVVSDARGMLLSVEGNAHVLSDAADELNFTEGASWSEEHAGTNAIGTALAARHAVQVFATEHFNEAAQAWTCAAAPVRDPDTGELLGVVDLTARAATAHPHSFASAVATARAVEAQLHASLIERQGRLQARYADLLTGGGKRVLVGATGRVVAGSPEGWTGTNRVPVPAGGGELMLPSGVRAFAEPVGREEGYLVRAIEPGHAASGRALLKLPLLGQDRPVVELDGRSVRLTRRHTEILALLTLSGGRMTSEQLAAELYGRASQPAAARVEVSRLRKALGGGIDPEPYALAMDVESDVAVVRGLLGRGEVRAAAERYHDPILPHSQAPGVVRQREALDSWVRHAVMTSDDADAVWAWVQSSSGGDDLPAWKRLIAHLDFSDPRRALAAARVKSLRTRYAAA